MSTPRKLTEKQAAILKYIIGYIEEKRYPPSIREVGDHFRIRSTNGVFDHLNALVRKEYIKREYFTSRSITILRGPDGKPFQTPADKIVAVRKKVAKLKREAKKRGDDGTIREYLIEIEKAAA